MSLPLADGGGVVVWVIIAIIVGIGKLIKAAGGAAKAPPATTRSSPARSAESEEERTRKFLEALGLPTQTLAPKSGSQTIRPAWDKAGAQPVQPPPPIPQAMRGLREALPHNPPSSMKRPSRAEVEAQRLEKKLRHAEQHRASLNPPPLARGSQETAIEKIHFAELGTLQTPDVPAFQTRSSEVSAIPFEAMNSVAGQLYRREESARMNELIALARSPRALRQAILVREILGPPRSLQSHGANTNFAPL